MNAYLNLTLLILPYVLSASKRMNQSYTCLLYALKLAVYGTNLVHGHQVRTLFYPPPPPPNLVPQVVILGVWDGKIQNLTLVNHLILIFKRYIYLKRKDGLNFYGLKAYIKSIENIERHIASQRQKLDYHHKKWNKLISVL